MKTKAQLGQEADPDDTALANIEAAFRRKLIGFESALARAYILGHDAGRKAEK